MNTPLEDDRDARLARLIAEAVDPVEPADRLAEIRHSLQTDHPHKETTMSARRPWTYVLLGAVGTAAVIGGIAFASGQLGSDDPGRTDPASSSPTTTDEPTEAPSETTDPSPDETSSEGPSESPSESPSATTGTTALGIYYVGDTERAGPRLYREFRRGPDSLDGALDLLMSSPQDPDYRTLWPAGSLESATRVADTIVVQIADGSLHDRPADMSAAEADAAIEQVIWTVQAAAQDRAPVQFKLGSNPIDQVYGVPTSEPLSQGRTLDVLSHLNITTPEQGATVTDVLAFSGVANSFEANVGWEIRRGDEVVKQGFATTSGWMEERLFPFAKRIQVGDLAPGDYTLFATTDDPSGGMEGIGAMTDTKDFTVQ